MKDLKKEYEELILPEISDLWDRIEAALPAEELPISTPTTNHKKPISIHKNKIYKWSSIVAACICAFVIIPVAMKDIQGCGSDMTSMEEAPAADQGIFLQNNVYPEDAADEYMEEADAAASDNGYYRNDVMEEQVVTSKGEKTEGDSNGSKYFSNSQTAEQTVQADAMAETFESEYLFEVMAQIESEIIEGDKIAGYQLLVTEDLPNFMDTNSLIGYLSDEYKKDMDKIHIVPGDTYKIQIRTNEDKQYFEILSINK